MARYQQLPFEIAAAPAKTEYHRSLKMVNRAFTGAAPSA